MKSVELSRTQPGVSDVPVSRKRPTTAPDSPVMRYLWDEAHGGHYSVSGPFEQCPQSEVVAASDYDALLTYAVELKSALEQEGTAHNATISKLSDCEMRLAGFQSKRSAVWECTCAVITSGPACTVCGREYSQSDAGVEQ